MLTGLAMLDDEAC